MKKCVLRNFTKFKGKHLCQSVFFEKVAGLKNTFSTEHLWTNAFLLRTVRILELESYAETVPFHKTSTPGY